MAEVRILYVCGCGRKFGDDQDAACQHSDEKGHRMTVQGYIEPDVPKTARAAASRNKELQRAARKQPTALSSDTIVSHNPFATLREKLGK